MRFESIRLALNKLLDFRKFALEAGTAEEQAEAVRIGALIQNQSWRPDSAWLGALPTLLCGPILRKVLVNEVTVWVALKVGANVTLTILERGPNGEQGAQMFSDARRTVRIGEHLHVAAVTARSDQPAQRLAHGGIYYYNLSWESETESGSLNAHRADLVYGDDPLPSLTVPPLDLNELRILHGSCRNVIGSGYDATPNLNHLLDKSFDKTTKKWTHTRPHQLFLTGDQIYADEGNDILLNLVGEGGDALLAGLNQTGLVWEEELPVDNNLVLIDPANNNQPVRNSELPNTPRKLYPGLRTVREDELCLGLKNAAGKAEPFDLLFEGLKFTAKSGNHLFGLGEFFATYLFVWSDKVWTGIFREPEFAVQMSKMQEAVNAAEKAKRADNDDREQNVRMAEAILGRDFFKHLVDSNPDSEAEFKELAEWFHLSVNTTPDKRKEAKENAAKKIAKGFVGIIKTFFKFTITAQGVSKVRRGLANVATYMMFDDHEVTDDWHMTHDWVKEVYASPIARRVIQNALCGFALFQAWGNTPERFEADDEPGKKFLDAIEDWVAHRMPAGAEANKVLQRVVPCKLLENGNVDEIPLQKDGALVGSEEVIRWDYGLSFGSHEAIVTDARTRRSFTERELAPAEHISKEAIKLQAPNTQVAELEQRFTLLVSPCNIVTIPDFRKGFVGTALPIKVSLENIITSVHSGRVPKANIFNYDPDFADSWVVADGPFERLIARLASRVLTVENQRLPARVIVLSGDVHFSATSRLQYWAANKPFDEAEGVTNMVMAHLVSSGLKNENDFWYKLHHMGFELVDIFDDEKRLPKTEVLAGYGKKVNDLTPAELDKRKELIEKTRWYPNYRAKMFAPKEEGAPSILPYHQTDPAVKIPPPDWFYRIDHMRGKKPKPVDPNDPKLHKFGNLDGTLDRFFKNQIEHFKYGKNFAAGLELIAINSIAELTFGWEGKGKLAEALTTETSQFLIRVEDAFPRTPFQIIIDNEIIHVSKVESLGLDLRVLECTRGAAKTIKAAHAAEQALRVRKVVSQVHWIAKAKQEDKLPTSIDDVECAEFTRYDITMEFDDLEYPKPVLNV